MGTVSDKFLSVLNFGSPNMDVMRRHGPVTRCLYGKDVLNFKSNMDEIFQLRYQVYCKEMGFIPKGKFPDCREIDEYDNDAIHIASYNRDDFILGTVRLVRPTISQLYPFEYRCKPFSFFRLPERPETAEISRLILTKKIRGVKNRTLQTTAIRQSELEASVLEDPAQFITASSEMILLSMFREMYRSSIKNGIRYWYATMEKGLAKQLFRMGFEFIQIGRQADYFGPVMPYVADIRDLEISLKKQNDMVSRWFNEDIEPWTSKKLKSILLNA